MSKRSWMHTKKITMNKLDPNGKPVIESVTVAQFVEMYNTQNMVFTRTTQYSQALLGQLYLENPNNPFFKKIDPKLLKYAQNKAEEIKKNPALGVIEYKEPKEVPKETFEKAPDNIVPLKKTDEKLKKDEETF
jgi:hypothetical protein